jgi:hypothetical protein
LTKVLVYGPADGPSSPTLKAAADGLATIGCPIYWRRGDLYAGEVESGYDLVVVSGMRRYCREVMAKYNQHGIHGVTLDYGYLQRAFTSQDVDRYWQVGIDGLNWLYPDIAKADRLAALDIDIKPAITAKDEREVKLVCGQYPGDAAHDLDFAGMQKWAEDSVDALRDLTDMPIVWRPHPAQLAIEGKIVPCRNADETSLNSLETDLARTDFVVTYCSNVGHDALLAGIPVYADRKAMYAKLCQPDLQQAVLSRCPSVNLRKAYFQRVAYSQWTLPEVSEGLPFMAMEKWLWQSA